MIDTDPILKLGSSCLSSVLRNHFPISHDGIPAFLDMDIVLFDEGEKLWAGFREEDSKLLFVWNWAGCGNEPGIGGYVVEAVLLGVRELGGAMIITSQLF